MRNPGACGCKLYIFWSISYDHSTRWWVLSKLSFNPCSKLYNNCWSKTSRTFCVLMLHCTLPRKRRRINKCCLSYLLVSLPSKSYLLTVIHTLVYMNLQRTITSITIHVALVTVCSNVQNQRSTWLQSRYMYGSHWSLLFSMHVAAYTYTLPLISCFLWQLFYPGIFYTCL